MVELRSMIVSLSLTACVSSQPVGGTPDEEGTGGESGGASSGGEADTDDSASSGEVEETHVVILEDCGIELSCEPLTTNDVGTLGPPLARDCLVGLYAAGMPAVFSHDYVFSFEPPFPALAEDAFVFQADRRIIRQSRERDCSAGPTCEDGPWLPWGPHLLCDAEPYFGPDGLDCEEVPDFTCDALVAILAEPANPPVPCEERSQEDCAGLTDLETECGWIEELSNYSADSCEPTTAGACISFGRGPNCEPNPTCEGAGAENVLFREREDGSVDIFETEYCQTALNFGQCSWGEPGSDDPPGPLEVGPAACDCAC